MRRFKRCGQPESPPDGTLPLTALRVGEGGYVRQLPATDPPLAQKLLALGVMPGAFVKVIQRFPAYVLQVGYTQIAIDHQLARCIWVQPAPEE